MAVTFVKYQNGCILENFHQYIIFIIFVQMWLQCSFFLQDSTGQNKPWNTALKHHKGYTFIKLPFDLN